MWTELPEFCRIWHDKQREDRLENPVKNCFEHGSGAYMKRSRMNRTLAFSTLKKIGKSQESWYYHTLKYMMNNITTRKWIIETGRKQERNINICNTVVDNHECPICNMTGSRYIQTKEHIWTGECEGTKDLAKKWVSSVEEICKQKNIKESTIIYIIEKIKTERDLVETQTYSINNHGKAAVLMGMWSNDTIIGIRNAMMYEGWETGKAMLMTMMLMQEVQKTAEEIAYRVHCNLDIFIQNLTEKEIEEYKKTNDKEDTNNSRILAVKFNKWKDSKICGLDRDTWEYWAYVKDQAIKQHIPTKEIEIQIQKSIGKQKVKMLREIKKYKEWNEVPVRLVEEVKRERRREIEYKKKRKTVDIEDIIVYLINKYEQQPSIMEIIANNKLYLKQAWEVGTEIIEEREKEKKRRSANISPFKRRRLENMRKRTTREEGEDGNSNKTKNLR